MNKKTNIKLIIIIISIVIILVLLIVGLCVAGWWYVNSKLDKMDYVELPANEIAVNTEVVESSNVS